MVASVGVASFVVGSMAFVVPVDALAPSAESPAAPIGPTAAKPSTLQYVVQNGDYLWGIAIKLNVKFVDLLTVNSFTMQTVIHPGQAVVVPDGGTLPLPGSAGVANPAGGTPAVKTPAVKTPAVKTPAVVVNPGVYVIISGDSLAGIAKKMGVSVPALLAANKLTLTSVIHPGAQMSVPAGGHLPTPTVAAIENGATSSVSPASANRINDTPNVPANSPTNANPSNNAPGPGTNPAAPTRPAGYTSYTIVAGDYLVGIATKSGVTLKALLAANNLITTSAIMPGDQLNVPPPTLPIPAQTPVPASTTNSSNSGTASGTAAANGSAAGQTPSQQSIAKVLVFLTAQVGKPYVFDSAGPDAYDCSGLVTAAYHQIGIELPHQSQLQSTMGTAVDWLTQPLLPGDLVFQYSSANPTVIGHVGIVMDSTHWIQAAGSGTPVRIGPLPSIAKIRAVRRIVQP